MSSDEKYFDGMPESYWREKKERQAHPAEECNTEHLKDCPFCGSRPVREVRDDVLFIRCPECLVSFTNHVRFGCWGDARWNRRQDDEL